MRQEGTPDPGQGLPRPRATLSLQVVTSGTPQSLGTGPEGTRPLEGHTAKPWVSNSTFPSPPAQTLPGQGFPQVTSDHFTITELKKKNKILKLNCSSAGFVATTLQMCGGKPGPDGSAWSCPSPSCHPQGQGSLTSKVALGQGFRGRLEPIILTTLRAEPWGLFCQMGMVYKNPQHTVNISTQCPSGNS